MTTERIAALWRRALCWWFGCHPIYAAEHYGEVMPCERCGAPDTSYSDRVGDTRHARMVDRLRGLRWRMFDSWRKKPCHACGRRKCCAVDCDGIPF